MRRKLVQHKDANQHEMLPHSTHATSHTASPTRDMALDCQRASAGSRGAGACGCGVPSLLEHRPVPATVLSASRAPLGSMGSKPPFPWS